MNRFKHILFFLVLTLSANALAQPGPNWPEIINKNKDMMKRNKVKESKVLSLEVDVPALFYYEYYDTNGLIQASYDLRMGKIGRKVDDEMKEFTRVYWQKIEFDYSDPDTLWVVGYNGEIEGKDLPLVDTTNWREYAKERPEKWNESYRFAYGRDAQGFYKFEGDRYYNEDGTLNRIDKIHREELVSSQKFFYDDQKRQTRIEVHQKTRENGYRHIKSTYYTYLEGNDPDSVYSEQYCNPLGYPDTVITQRTIFKYDEKGRPQEELHYDKSRLRNSLIYDYSNTDKTGTYTYTRLSFSGRTEGVITYYENNLEKTAIFYTTVGALKRQSRSEYIFHE